MEILADSTATSIIHAPIEQIDLTEWLFTLQDEAYQACSKSHIACGSSVSHDGCRISINVERIAGNMLVQHYKEGIGKRDHCLVKSHSDSFSAMGDTKLDIIWEIKVKSLTKTSCEFSNHVTVLLTEEFQKLLKKLGVHELRMVRAGMEENVKQHNLEETPLFARDIEGKALAGVW